MSELPNPEQDLFARFHKITPEINGGVEIYDAEGEPFWQTASDNRELLKQKTTWAFACQAGYARSAKAVEGFKKLGIPTSVRKENIDPEQGTGIDYPNLGILILNGTYQNGLITPEDYSEGFNRLAIFYSGADKTRVIAKYMGKIANTISIQQNEGKALELEIILVEVDEPTNQRLIKDLK